MRVAPDDLSLLLRWVQEPEAVLKAPAVSDFSFEFHRLSHLRELEFQFNNFTNHNVARNCCAQAAFRNIFGAAMLRFFAFHHQEQVQQKPGVGPGLGPWMLFIRNWHLASETLS